VLDGAAKLRETRKVIACYVSTKPLSLTQPLSQNNFANNIIVWIQQTDIEPMKKANTTSQEIN